MACTSQASLRRSNAAFEIEPDYDSFAWQVLSTLAASSEIDQSGGRFTVRFAMRSSAVGDGL